MTRGGEGREVVVTGVSAIGAHGTELAQLDRALRAGKPLVRPVADPPSTAPLRRCREIAGCPDLDLTPWVTLRAARRMSQLSQFAVASGRMTLQAANWPEESGRSLAVCLASHFGPANYVIQLMQQILSDPMTASPFLFTDSVANGPSGQLAIAVAARDANYTVTQREAGPLLSLIQGALEIRTGRCSAILVGSMDEVEAYQLSILDRMRALAPDGEHVRPFDRRRCGVLFGEGAGSLLLEDEACAVGKPLAKVKFWSRAFDPTASRAGWGTGYAALGSGLAEKLKAAGIDPDSIDAVVSGASGARHGDWLEGRTLGQAFGARVPPVLVPKAVVGEYGCGGVLAAGVLALAGGTFRRPAGFQELDPDIGIEPFDGDLPAPRRVLLSGLGSGGAAAWVILEAVD